MGGVREGHPDWSAAPRGAFRWWADAVRNTPGHVALDLDGGGTRCLMATTHLSGGEDFGPGRSHGGPVRRPSTSAAGGPVRRAVDVNGWQAVQTAVDVNGWQAVQTAVRG